MNTTENPPPGDQGLAFQTHALQMILFGPFLRANPTLLQVVTKRVLTKLIINKLFLKSFDIIKK